MKEAEILRPLLEGRKGKQPKAAITPAIPDPDPDEDSQTITKSKKSTKAGIIARLMILEQLLLKGWSYGQIVEYGRRNWDIGRANISKYLEQIREKWSEVYAEQSKTNLELAINRREMLYKKTLAEDDKALALMILNSLDKIKGLFVDRVENSNELKGPVEVRFEGIDFAIENQDK